MQTGPIIDVIHGDQTLVRQICQIADSLGFRTEILPSPYQFFDSYQSKFHGCLIVDLHFETMSGARFLDEMAARSIPVPVIFVTSCADTASIVEVMKRGAVTLLESPSSNSELKTAIQEAIKRDRSQRAKKLKQQQYRSRLSTLNEKERVVMDFVVGGIPNKVIAKRLNVSVRTVESRRQAVFQKMHVESLAELVRLVVAGEAE